jgi:hypothetical protein
VVTVGSLFYLPVQTVIDATGEPLPGAFLYFYQSQTSTPQTVYADSGLTTALPNPVPSNAAGQFPPIYIGSSAYKVVLTDQYGNQIWTADPFEFVEQTPAPAQSSGFTDLANYSPNANAIYVPSASINIGVNNNLLVISGYLANTADIGKTIVVAGAGALLADGVTYDSLITTIAASSTGSMTLTAGAAVSVSGAQCVYGNPDDAAFSAAIAAAGPQGRVIVPGGGLCYLLTQNHEIGGTGTLSNCHEIEGLGWPTIFAALPNHTIDLFTISGQTAIIGSGDLSKQPIMFKGLSLDLFYTGRHAVYSQQLNRSEIKYEVHNTYWNGFNHTDPANNNSLDNDIWITGDAGFHLFYVGEINASTYFNNNRVRLSAESFGYMSGPVLCAAGGTYGSLPAAQLGAAMYVSIKGGSSGGFADFLCNKVVLPEIAGNSGCNLSPVVFADPRISHLIEGAANSTATGKFYDLDIACFALEGNAGADGYTIYSESVANSGNNVPSLSRFFTGANAGYSNGQMNFKGNNQYHWMNGGGGTYDYTSNFGLETTPAGATLHNSLSVLGDLLTGTLFQKNGIAASGSVNILSITGAEVAWRGALYVQSADNAGNVTSKVYLITLMGGATPVTPRTPLGDTVNYASGTAFTLTESNSSTTNTLTLNNTGANTTGFSVWLISFFGYANLTFL